MPRPLLKRARNTGKCIVGVGSDQTNGPDDQYQDDGQHHRVFSNVLAFLL